MCGRYTLTCEGDELVEAFDVPPLDFTHRPSYNIAPGQTVPVLAQDARGRRLGRLTWGLLPSWFDKPGRGFVNARSETVTQTPSFRESILARRCLIPADGFYEWAEEDGTKTPYWFHDPDGGLFTMAAIWDRWQAADEEPRHTFAILTTEAGEGVRAVHHRMPVVIEPGDRDAWLDRDTQVNDVLDVMAKTRTWTGHQVSRRVGSPANDEPGLIEAV